MSLDVYLELEDAEFIDAADHIYIRIDGAQKEITRAEWDLLYPNRAPVTLAAPILTNEIYTANITHNLNAMAQAAGIYDPVWCPDENNIERAAQLIAPLERGLVHLRATPEHYKQFNPRNGWGTYEGLITFLQNYLDACRAYPSARVSVWR